MQDTINKILYLTHDKWKDKSIIKYRDEFEQYLKLFLELNPQIENDLIIMLEYIDKNEALLTYKGLMNLLKTKNPEIHKKICLRIFSKNKKAGGFI